MKSIYSPTIEDVYELNVVNTLPPGGLDIIKYTAEISDMSEGKKVLVIGGKKDIQGKIYNSEFNAEVYEISNSINETGISYSDDFFDIVINEGFLANADDPLKVFEEMRRVCKEDGKTVFRDAVFKECLSEAEKKEISLRYGKNVLTFEEWNSFIKQNKAEIIKFDETKWSNPSVFWKVRTEFDVEDFQSIYTAAEKMRLSMQIMRKYGREGINMSSENEKVFLNAVLEGKVFYSVFLVKKV